MMLVASHVAVSWSAIAPEVVLLAGACVLLMFAVFLPDPSAHAVSVIVALGALAAAMVAPIVQWHDAPRLAFGGTLRIDAFGNGARLLIFAAALLAVVLAWGLPAAAEHAVEYHALLLAGCAGMSLLAVANSLLILFVALELFSICLYVLVAIDTDELPGLEGALKYLIIGSIGAASNRRPPPRRCLDPP